VKTGPSPKRSNVRARVELALGFKKTRPAESGMNFAMPTRSIPESVWLACIPVSP
jgi:hypothetical protein